MTGNLTLARPLIAFDVETTGLDVRNDRIVEICCVKMFPDGRRETRTQRLNPGMPIGAAATQIHGISDADVADKPSFADLAADLFAFLQDADLTGFNIEQFDLPLLKQEFARVALTFPQAPVHIIDSWRIFLRHEPRDLAAATQFYCGRDLKDAHSAEADAQAAADILWAQVQRYDVLPKSVAALDAYCHPKNPDHIDADGKLMWVGEEAALGFGRYKHKLLKQLLQDDPAYLRWIAQANFSDEVVSLINGVLGGSFPRRNSAQPPPL